MRKRFYKKMLALISVFAILFSMFPVAAVPTINAATTDLEQDLVLWYDFENAKGTNVTDASGNGNDGTLVNDATITSDTDKGGAVDLDGDRDYVTVPNGIFEGLTDVTISSWVKFDTAKDWATMYAFGNFVDGENSDYAINYAPKAADTEKGSIELFGPYPFPSVETNELPTQEWVHVTTVISDQTMYHYTNGELNGSVNIGIDAGDINVNANNYIGFHAMPHEQIEGKGLDGKVADFRVYNRALDLTEIRTLADFDFSIDSIEEVNVTTAVGEAPSLPTQVTVTYPNGTTDQVAVTWDEIESSAYGEAGSFVVEGTLEGTELKAKANVTVTATKYIVSVDPVFVTTGVDEEPNLPETVTVTYANESTEDVSVTWDAIAASQYSRAGLTFNVEGTIDGTSETARATVNVTTDVSGDLVTWYKFDEVNGATVPDVSGSEKNGTVHNGATVSTVDSKYGIDFEADDEQYVTMPSDIVEGLEDFTLSTWVYMESKTGDWARIFDFGTGPNSSTIFLTPNLHLDNQGAVVTATSGAPKVGEWTHLAVAKSGDQYTIYSNGTAVATMEDDTPPGNTTMNYIGWSNYAVDPYFDGQFSDFRIYNQGLEGEEIKQVIAESFSDEEAVSKAKEVFTIEDTSAVVDDIELPTNSINGVSVSWSSSNTDIVSEDGVVTRPGLEEQDAEVTLTATLSRGDYSDTKEFTVKVLADNIVSVDEVEVITPANFPPKLPEKVTVHYYDESTDEVSVDWDTITANDVAENGSTVEVEGIVYGTDISAVAKVYVSELVSVDDVQVTTTSGKAPELPETVTAHYSNGQSDELAVSWDEINKSQYQETGSFTVEGSAAKYQYTNPLIEQRADPNIYKHTDGYYYFTASVPEYNRIILRRAKTIQGLATAEEKVIWEAHASGEQSAHIWAPEIHFQEGNWYIHYAAGGGDGDIWKIRPYVIENTNANPLEGEWVEKGRVQTSEEDDFSFTDFSLDATVFEHNGKSYYIWAQKENGISNLYMDELVNPWTIKGEPMLLSTPDYAWERIGFWVNEGPDVIKRNGKIFVTFSASATNANYKIGLLTADEDSDIMNPDSWTKSPEPVMESNDATSQYGPGHSTFTVAEDGVTDILVYHARSYKEIDGDPLYDPNRHTRVKVLTWNEDGTPHFGVPNGDGVVNGPTVEVKATILVVDDSQFEVTNHFNIKELTANEEVEANVSITNNGASEAVTVVMALYDGNNKMVGMETKSTEIGDGERDDVNLSMNLPKDIKDHKLKTFVWKGESLESSNLEPVSQVFEMN
ncbi:family 43 glycosylhydrolase [Aquibacillus kalidii]|uniref:family 43 glycosylhydrolase n=1 Tax=Aquibacillus kalidii TaxID=2762597 RepID=UPI0016486B78|nr:family 43 glycosylhydrolase [Aquibacillus kalidii]